MEAGDQSKPQPDLRADQLEPAHCAVENWRSSHCLQRNQTEDSLSCEKIRSVLLKYNTCDLCDLISPCLNRSAIQWAKGDQLIPRGGKRAKRKRDITNAFVTKKGALRIPGIGYQDAGIYACMGKSFAMAETHFTHNSLVF